MTSTRGERLAVVSVRFGDDGDRVDAGDVEALQGAQHLVLALASSAVVSLMATT